MTFQPYAYKDFSLSSSLRDAVLDILDLVYIKKCTFCEKGIHHAICT